MWAYAGMAAVAAVVGFVGSVVGLAGGIFLVPLLTLGFGFEIHVAIGSTMLGLVPGAIFASIGYLRRGLADLPLAGLILVPTLSTTHLGAYLATQLSAGALKPFFGALLMLLAWRMVRTAAAGKDPGPVTRAFRRVNAVPPVYRRVAVDAQGHTFRYEASLLAIGILGILAGISAGLFGVGGGFITTPVLVLAYRVPIRVAVASSLFMVAVTAAVGSVSHYYYGNVDAGAALAMGIGLSAGGVLGPRAAAATPERILRRAVAGLLGAIGAGMAVSGAIEWS